MELNKEKDSFYAPTRLQWRKWLEKNGRKKKEVYLIIYHKKSKTKSVDYAEAVEEALCFGWIDSVKYKRDAESAYQRFSPRKPNSNWSRINIARAERLIKEGLMTRYGQEMIDTAREKGRWNK